jgi:hypothetical protein
LNETFARFPVSPPAPIIASIRDNSRNSCPFVPNDEKIS